MPDFAKHLRPTVATTAKRIEEAVRSHPGIHFRALGRLIAVGSPGQLRHHIDTLTRNRCIMEVKDGRFSRYFHASRTDGQADLARLARLSRPVPNQILRLLASGPLTRTQLRAALGCADSTLGYHLGRMLINGDVERCIGPSGKAFVTAAAVHIPELPWIKVAA